MGPTKQVKILSKLQQEAVLAYLGSTRYPARDPLSLLVSVRTGLTSKEIAALKWEILTNAVGELSAITVFFQSRKLRRCFNVSTLHTPAAELVQVCEVARDRIW